MKNLKKDLQAVNKKLSALLKKVEKLVAAAPEPEKSKPKTVKTKATKAAVAKAGKPATGPELVLDIIKRSKKGIDIDTLKTKTGFQREKLHKLVYRLKKRGEIKSPQKGIYLKA